MHLKVFMVLFSLLVCQVPASFAHFGHGEDYVMSNAEVIPMANQHVAGLIEEKTQLLNGVGILDESWNRIHDADKKIAKKEKGCYIVGFTNPKKKQTLYLLISLSGDLYDVNFSGNFEVKR